MKGLLGRGEVLRGALQRSPVGETGHDSVLNHAVGADYLILARWVPRRRLAGHRLVLPQLAEPLMTVLERAGLRRCSLCYLAVASSTRTSPDPEPASPRRGAARGASRRRAGGLRTARAHPWRPPAGRRPSSPGERGGRPGRGPGGVPERLQGHRPLRGRFPAVHLAAPHHRERRADEAADARSESPRSPSTTCCPPSRTTATSRNGSKAGRSRSISRSPARRSRPWSGPRSTSCRNITEPSCCFATSKE